MLSYENITQTSTPQGWSQSVTHEKDNTKQSNANSISQSMASIPKVIYFSSVKQTEEKCNWISSNKRQKL